MGDHEIRVSIIKKLLEKHECHDLNELASELGISKVNLQGNLRSLEKANYIVAACNDDEIVCISESRNSSSYLVAPDSSISNTVNVNGNSNIIAGRDLSIQNSNVLNSYGIPKEFDKELNELIDEIKNASMPKPNQASKVKAFLEKIASSCAGSAVAACATAIFKAAIGLL